MEKTQKLKNRSYGSQDQRKARPRVQTRMAHQVTGEEEDDIFPEGPGGEEGWDSLLWSPQLQRIWDTAESMGGE